MPSTLGELEDVATDIIDILKSITEYANARIAIIGGLAVWRYVRQGRTTQDVDFIVSISNAPHAVKERLLALPNSPFIQQAQVFYYKTPGGSNIPVDITPEWQSPYMPAGATELRDLPTGVIPCISETDLIVFKMNSCGLRALTSKKRVDAIDAETLLELPTVQTPLSLTDAQRAIVEPCIRDVVAHGTKTEEWWREHLSLPASR